MEVQSFNVELAIANMMFKRVFNNIKIERTHANGEVKIIDVACKLGQRSRILKGFENSNRKGTYKLPMIVINRNGYTRNGDRLNNLHNEVKYEISSTDRRYDLLTPIPIDISYEVSVIAKYPSDVDQIASNFMVFFNSNTFISAQHPKYEGIRLNNKIIMDDAVSEEHPDEIDGSANDFHTSTFTFTFQTFLFGGKKQAKVVQEPILSSFLSTYIGYETVKINPRDISSFCAQHPDLPVSATLSSVVTGEVTEYVDNPDLSDYVYDGFTPIVNSITLSLYPVPSLSDMTEYMAEVNQMPDEQGQVSGYISSESYLSGWKYYIDEEGHQQRRLSSLEPADYKYEATTISGSIFPYVDRLIWKIK